VTWIAAAIGGLIGTLARHGVNVAFARTTASPGPYATATVNVVGSLVIGGLAGAIAAGRLTLSAPARAFVFVGILGGFTTFSSFMLDTLTLAERGELGSAVANAVLQVLIGFAATYAAYRALL
jgi:fluoride exporter